MSKYRIEREARLMELESILPRSLRPKLEQIGADRYEVLLTGLSSQEIRDLAEALKKAGIR